MEEKVRQRQRKLAHLLLSKEVKSSKEGKVLKRCTFGFGSASRLEVLGFACETIGAERLWSMTESRRKTLMYTAPITAMKVETLGKKIKMIEEKKERKIRKQLQRKES